MECILERQRSETNCQLLPERCCHCCSNTFANAGRIRCKTGKHRNKRVKAGKFQHCFFSLWLRTIIFAAPNIKGIFSKSSGSKGAVAQSVEQRTENPCVGGSIPPHTTRVDYQMISPQLVG